MTPSPAPLPPVEGLKDIVLAPPVGFFPPAPGWYVLALLLLGLAVWAVLRYRRHRAANLYRRQALAELESLVEVLEHKGGRHVVAAEPYSMQILRPTRSAHCQVGTLWTTDSRPRTSIAVTG